MGYVKKDGRNWYFVAELRVDSVTGSRRRKKRRGFKSKADALRALKVFEYALKSGYELLGKPYLTVESFFIQWLEFKKSQLSIQTHRTYQSNLNNHIIPTLGNINIQDLQAYHLQKFYVTLSAKLSPATIVKIHKLIKTGLGEAYRQELIQKNVAEFIKPPRVPYKELNVWDEDQVKLFLDSSKLSPYYMVYFTAIITGMRRGEILGLRWKDINFSANTISIKQTLSSKGDMFLQPKTRTGLRTIPVPVQAIKALEQHKLKVNDYPSELVFSTPHGTPLDPSKVRKHFIELTEKVQLPRIRFHDLRHTHATLMLIQGVHPKIVSERLGHANVALTLNTYTHLLPGLQDEAVKLLGDSLFKKEG